VSPAAAIPSAAPLDALADFVAASRSLVVLTGAGCSTGSGIPDYRDEQGAWKHPRPVLLPDFLRDPGVRRRYWGRSIVGWPRFAAAAPNAAHHALAALGHAGRVAALVTQNVDRLHQQAGSDAAIDLHGRLDLVECLGCRAQMPRAALQVELEALNPDWEPPATAPGPDGDAQLSEADFSRFRVPACRRCGGILKPAVVFFGESIPAATRSAAADAFAQADAVLVVGSSLMVYSGYALVRDAARRGLPVACIGLGQTRADDLIPVRVAADCARALTALTVRLGISVTPR
jgi:NAD-dependent SIR2 family protein deacetylase